MSQLEPVTIDRVVEAMAGLGVVLEKDSEQPFADAVLNNRPTRFLAIGPTVIVRTDSLTDVPVDDASALPFLSANQFNAISTTAKAIVLDYADTLIMRTECEIPCGAGMTDEQLAASLQDAVDGVLGAQDVVATIAEQFEELGQQQ